MSKLNPASFRRLFIVAILWMVSILVLFFGLGTLHVSQESLLAITFFFALFSALIFILVSKKLPLGGEMPFWVYAVVVALILVAESIAFLAHPTLERLPGVIIFFIILPYSLYIRRLKQKNSTADLGATYKQFNALLTVTCVAAFLGFGYELSFSTVQPIYKMFISAIFGAMVGALIVYSWLKNKTYQPAPPVPPAPIK